MRSSFILIALLFCSALCQERNYPLYQQCNSEWANNILGTSDETICQVGCLMSSAAMLLRYYNVNVNNQVTTPGTYNQWLIEHNGYQNTDLYIWNTCDQLGLVFEGKITPQQVKATFDAGKDVILNVNAGHHWVLMNGYLEGTSTIFVNDPGYNKNSYLLQEVTQAGVYSFNAKWLTKFYNFFKLLTLSSSHSQFLGVGSCNSVNTMVQVDNPLYDCPIYSPTLGFNIIGYGYNLDSPNAKSEMASIGLNYNDIIKGTCIYDKNKIEQLLQFSLNSAIAGAKNSISNYGSQPPCVQNVLIDVSFDYPARISTMLNFRNYIINGNYPSAASDLGNSKWCRTFPQKCSQDTRILST